MKLCELTADIKGARLIGAADIHIRDIVYDSRKAGPDTVFVCMRGSRLDSHELIPEAYEKGCRAFAIMELPENAEGLYPDVSFVLCPDTREALSYMSQAFFDHPAKKLRLIGLTGTKGKTTTAYMIKDILEGMGHRVGVMGTVGCEIDGELFTTQNTTPESYEIQRYLDMMVKKGCTHAVMECSSQGFKMKRLSGMSFDVGAFLNITPDHIGPGEHADMDEYMRCKAMLFPASRRLFYNAGSEHLEEMFDISGRKRNEEGVSSFGLDRTSDYSAFDISYDELCGRAGMRYGFTYPGGQRSMFLAMPGEHNVLNALCASAVCMSLGADPEVIASVLSAISIKGRMEYAYVGHGFKVMVDYAHNEDSTEKLVRTLENYHPARLVLVFGCGGNRSVDRRIGMGRVAAREADMTIITSDNPRYEEPEAIIDDIEAAYLEAGGHKDRYVRITDRREAIAYAIEHGREGDLIAVIGKGHEEYQEIKGVRRHFSDREEIEKAGERLDRGYEA